MASTVEPAPGNSGEGSEGYLSRSTPSIDASPSIHEPPGNTCADGTDPTRSRDAVRGGVLGNFVDQFDIFLPVIALAPASAAVFGTSHLAANAGLIFASTLLGRPVGAFIFGPIADRRGRTATTKIALVGVAASTLTIALVPNHHVLGELTFPLILALRFIGGVFLGGEYTSAAPLALESTTRRRRGLVSGMIMWMSPWANATIAALTFGLVGVAGADGYAVWGWRIPFLIGALLAFGMLAYYRKKVNDSAAWRRGPKPRNSLAGVLSGTNLRALTRVLVLMTGLWLMTNIAVAVLTNALGSRAELTSQDVTVTMLIATAVSAPAMLAFGHLSTFTGRRRFFIFFGVTAAVAAPAIYLSVMHVTGLVPVIALASALQIVTVAAYGPIGAYLAEQFPAGVRASGYGIGYSLSIVVPALYPYYLPALQHRLGEVTAVSLLLAVAGVLISAGGWFGRGRTGVQ